MEGFIFASKMIKFIDCLGWIGAFGVLYAYYLSSTKNVLENPGLFLKYQLLNIIGAAGLLINSFYYGATPSVIVNLIWGLIGLLASAKMLWQCQELKPSMSKA